MFHHLGDLRCPMEAPLFVVQFDPETSVILERESTLSSSKGQMAGSCTL